jgi:5-methylcytosine-specific restriction endonuclease McrA
VKQGQPTEGQLRGRAWRVVKAKFRKHCQEVDERCWICDQQINYEANWREPTAFESDHAKPIKTHPHLALVMGNLRPSHQSCNRARGAKPLGGAWVRPAW